MQRLTAKLLLFEFLFLAILGVVLVILCEFFLPWSYYALSFFISVLLAALLYKAAKTFFLGILISSLLLWSIPLIASQFTTLFPIDTNQQFAHVKVLLETGYLVLNTNDPIPLINHPSSYPLLSLLTAILSVTLNANPINLAVSIPLVYGFTNILLVALVGMTLFNRPDKKYLVLSLATLFFVLNPDANPYFYNSFFSLTFFFILIFALIRIVITKNNSIGNRILIIFTLIILPLSTAYIPLVALYFIISFTLIMYFLKLFFRSNKKLLFSVIPLLLLISSFFYWNFQVLSSSPIANSLPRFVNNLLNPMPFGFGPVQRINGETGLLIPEILKPEPFIYLLSFREFMILLLPLLSMLFVSVLLFIKKRNMQSRNMLAVALMASFLPLILIHLFEGWTPWSFRYYASPVIIYFVVMFYFFLLENKHRVVKLLTIALISFLIFISFLAPQSHIYFSRQYYDPSVDFKAVGIPQPAYLNLQAFLEKNALENVTILADDRSFLVVTEPKDYPSIQGFVMTWPFNAQSRYGESNTYIVELIGLGHYLAAPAYQREYVQEMSQINSTINQNYSKIVDSGEPYSIFCETS